MAKDLYEGLLGYYEFIMGPLPRREEFRRTLEETVSATDLRIYFLLPFAGNMPLARLQRKARLPMGELTAALDRLASQGLIMAYTAGQSQAYERADPIYMTEQQVRKAEDTPRRRSYAEFFNTLLSGEFVPAAPNKTPYFRVLPVEATVAEPQGPRTLAISVPIPDRRAVLPIDVVSEMIRRGPGMIAVADCYCRKARRLLGEGCEYPLQTCLIFGKGAEALVTHGTARRIDINEAMAIMRLAEEQGLVHNVDNCEDQIGAICNCCACCSILLNTWKRGVRNAESPSRYLVAYERARCAACGQCLARCPTGARTLADGRVTNDEALCLGCGLCAGTCPQGANRMALRARQPRIPRTGGELASKVTREAVVGFVRKKVLGR